jgi:hypothetical protein
VDLGGAERTLIATAVRDCCHDANQATQHAWAVRAALIWLVAATVNGHRLHSAGRHLGVCGYLMGKKLSALRKLRLYDYRVPGPSPVHLSPRCLYRTMLRPAGRADQNANSSRRWHCASAGA